jgi:excisionase family DNA binding protein
MTNWNRPIQQPIIIHIHNVPPRWLDAPTAASYLSCGPNIIEELWRSSELPYVMVGCRKRVVEKADLDAWCDRQKKETTSSTPPKAPLEAPQESHSSCHQTT